MKKLYVLMLPLMILSLVGCKKDGVKYTEIEDVSSYYTEENKAAAKLAANELNIGILSASQVGPGMKYTFKRSIDYNYVYEYSKMVMDGVKTVGKALYLANFDNPALAVKYYVEVVGKEKSQELKTGESVNTDYTSDLNTLRSIIIENIDEPLSLAKTYIGSDPIDLHWYKGSDGTLKVTCVNEDETVKASTIVYADTLFVKKVTVKLADIKATLTQGVSYPTEIKHLTDKDIGYEID